MRPIGKLSAVSLSRLAKTAGLHGDGGGLYLASDGKREEFTFIPGERFSLDASIAHSMAAALNGRVEKVRTGTAISPQAPVVQLATSVSGLPIRFSPPGANKWLVARPKSRWRWTGQGNIRFEGIETVIRGRRARPFWSSAKQEVRFPNSDVINVVVEGSAVRCEVKQPYGKSEALAFWAGDDAAARQIASNWPAERTAAFSQALVDSEAFNAALQSVGTTVVVTWALVVINVLAYALLVFRGVDAMHPSGADLIPWGSNYALQTLSGEWWRLFTSMYLHFGLFHLLFNMWALASMGPLMERSASSQMHSRVN